MTYSAYAFFEDVLTQKLRRGLDRYLLPWKSISVGVLTVERVLGNAFQDRKRASDDESAAKNETGQISSVSITSLELLNIFRNDLSTVLSTPPTRLLEGTPAMLIQALPLSLAGHRGQALKLVCGKFGMTCLHSQDNVQVEPCQE